MVFIVFDFGNSDVLRFGVERWWRSCHFITTQHMCAYINVELSECLASVQSDGKIIKIAVITFVLSSQIALCLQLGRNNRYKCVHLFYDIYFFSSSLPFELLSLSVVEMNTWSRESIYTYCFSFCVRSAFIEMWIHFMSHFTSYQRLHVCKCAMHMPTTIPNGIERKLIKISIKWPHSME